MKKFKEDLKIKFLMGIPTFILICAIAFLITTKEIKLIGSSINSFIRGLLTGIAVVFLVNMIKIFRTIKNDKELEKLYINLNDERNMMIRDKVGIWSVTIILNLLLISIFISAMHSATITLTLTAVIVIVSIITFSLKIYFGKKY